MQVTVLAARLAGDRPFHSERFRVRTPVLRDPLDYWRVLDGAWRLPGVLVNVEHDMEFSDALVRGLVECPHVLCTYPYRCYLSGRRHWVYSPQADGRWVERGTEWADTATLGFCKIAREARDRPLQPMIWKFLEHSVCSAVAGFSQLSPNPDTRRRRWHVHWPEIAHHHDYDAEAWENASDWERFCAENGEPCHEKPSESADDVRSIRTDEVRGGKLVEVTAPPARETR